MSYKPSIIWKILKKKGVVFMEIAVLILTVGIYLVATFTLLVLIKRHFDKIFNGTKKHKTV